MSASSSFDRPLTDAPHLGDAPPEERSLLCGQCGLQFTSAGILDYCDSCGAPRCRSCAALAGDDMGGVYLCSTCGSELDTLWM